MSLTKHLTSVTSIIVAVRVVNRVGGFGMSFLGLRLARDLGASMHDVGLVLAAFGACTIPSRLLGGLLTTRIGGRATIVLGLTGCSVTQLVIAWGSTMPVVVAGVLALGIVYELIEPASQAMLVEAVPRGRQTSTFALLWASLSVAGVVSGMVAAVLLSYGAQALFFADAASGLAAAVVAWRLLPRTPARTDRAPLLSVVSRRLLLWTTAGTAYATLVMTVVFMLPLAIDTAGLAAWVPGAVLAVAAASAMGSHRLVRRWETRMSATGRLVTGHVLLAAGLGLWAVGELPTLLAGAVLEGASGTWALGTYQAVAASMAGRGQTPGVMAIFGLSWGVAAVVAPMVGTRLMDAGPALLWCGLAGASALMAAGHLASRCVRSRSCARHAGVSHT